MDSVKSEASELGQTQSGAKFVRPQGVISGVAEGLAKTFELDIVLFRIAWLLVGCLGFGILAYICCWIAMPKATDPESGNYRRILGVCHQIAKRSKQPVGLIRIAAITFLFLSGGTVIFGYPLAYLVLAGDSN